MSSAMVLSPVIVLGEERKEVLRALFDLVNGANPRGWSSPCETEPLPPLTDGEAERTSRCLEAKTMKSGFHLNTKLLQGRK